MTRSAAVAGLTTALALAVPAPAYPQVEGKSTGQCNYNDGRGWVQCGDYPAGGSSDAPSGGLNPQQQMMMDAAGQLGSALGAALGRQLSGEADRDKAQEINNQAIAAANRGDWHRARALTLQALKLVPDDAVLKGNLAFCDRQIAESERQEAARRQDQERARQRAEAAAAARRREEIAQHIQGQMKLGDGGSQAPGVSPEFKLGDAPEPVAVASAAPPSGGAPGFKLGEQERSELRDSPNDPRKAKRPAPPRVALGPPGRQGDGYWHLKVTNEEGPAVSPRACVQRADGKLNRLQLEPPLQRGQSRDFVYDQGTVRAVTTDGSDPCLATRQR